MNNLSEHSSSLTVHSKHEAYVPFGSKLKRQFLPITKDTPPVGTYQIRACFNQSKRQGLLLNNTINQNINNHINQHSFFKSAVKRFPNKNEQQVGPAEYNLSPKGLSKKYEVKSSKNCYLQNFPPPKGCPSIPSIKYGYTKDSEGRLKVVEKSQTQLQKEKEKLKDYTKTLFSQKIYKKSNSGLSNWQIKKAKELQTMKEKTKNYLKSTIQNSPNKLRCKIIETKINKKIQTKEQRQFFKIPSALGPGQYMTNLNTLNVKHTQQKYQFFGSTEQRFKVVKSQPKEEVYYDLSRSRISKKNKIIKKLTFIKPLTLKHQNNNHSCIKFHQISRQNKLPNITQDSRYCINNSPIVKNKKIKQKSLNLTQHRLSNIFKNHKILQLR